MRDVGSVADSTDIPTGYALVNGRRAVYIPVTKRPDASTLTVVNEVKQNLARFRTLVPSDIAITYQFDQSGYVKSALLSVVREGLLGALLTGLVVLLFLGDWRSSLIVLTTIPFALLTSVMALWLTGQTLNIMTLGGLALAVGILVDEGVVEIENIDSTLFSQPELAPARAVLQATQRTVTPRFLSMLAMIAVFVPSLMMTGVAKSMFVPLSLAVASALVASFLLSSSLLPVLFLWMHGGGLPGRSPAESRAGRWTFERVRNAWTGRIERLRPWRWLALGAYLVLVLAVLGLLGPRVGKELFPNVSGHQFRLRFDAPTGTRAEVSARLVKNVLDEIQTAAGPGNIDLSLGYVGTQGASYPINTVFLWTSGPQEAVMNVALRPEASLNIAALEEKLRQILPAKFPDCSFSFEPGDIGSQIMNFGSPTPVELAVTGPGLRRRPWLHRKAAGSNRPGGVRARSEDRAAA